MKGVITKVYYENESGFMIARLRLSNNDYCNVLGELCGLKKGDSIEIFDYRIENHKDFGKQLRVLSWAKSMPTTRQGVVDFFRSGLIKGVGDKRANTIVDILGENAVKLISEEGSDVLRKVPGIGPKLSKEIYGTVLENQQLQGIVQELSALDMSFNMAMKAYSYFGPGVANILRLNPYRLIELKMVSFLKADAIARNIGIKPNSLFRIIAAIEHVFDREAQRKGHCYLLVNDVVSLVKELLGEPVVEGLRIKEIIEQQIGKGYMEIEGERLYRRSYYLAEVALSSLLQEIKGASIDSAKIEEALSLSVKAMGVDLSPEQERAVKLVFTKGVSVITGGPGTGKTLTVKAVVETCRALGMSQVMLCAPTGRAAKVLSSVTGWDAQTLHRLLSMQPGGRPSFNADNKLPCELVVVDEASMMDLFLAKDFFEAIPESAHVLLVGDCDQLPPVGPGNVFRDVLAAGVPHVSLRQVYRQSETSAIVTNAHAVNRGIMPTLTSGNGFYFIEKSEPDETVDVICRVCKRLFQKGYSLEDVQVLSPMRKGSTGINNLNNVLQDVCNTAMSKEDEFVYGSTTFRTGDKVMQIRNNYEKQVFNGDVGIVSFIGLLDNDERGIVVKFNGFDVPYSGNDFADLSLAYAMTIHKSQGCEFPVVVVVLTTQHYIMLARNLVYTAISRARNKFVLVGTKKALAIAINNNHVLARNTGLSGRLEGCFGGSPDIDLAF